MSDTVHKDWKAWTGVEVEGRMRGVPTLFIRNPRGLNIDKIPHDHVLVGRCWVNDVYLLKRLLDSGKMVTIEASMGDLRLLPNDIFKRVVIIYDIVVGSIVTDVNNLKPGDMIRFGQFDCTLYDVSAGRRSVLSEYTDDIEWPGDTE